MDIVVTLPHTEAWPSDGGVLVSLAGGQHDEELVDLVGFCISQHSISHTQTQVNTTQVRYIRIRSSFLCCLTYFKSTSRFISKGPCLAYRCTYRLGSDWEGGGLEVAHLKLVPGFPPPPVH